MVDVSCSSHKTACILSNQQIYIWGQCGSTDVSRPTLFNAQSASQLLILDQEKIIDQDTQNCLPEGLEWKQIFIKQKNLFLLGAWGKFTQVFACGDNSFGQLGHPHGKTLINPTLVPGLLDQQFKKITAASTHVLALTDDGQLFGWGSTHCLVGDRDSPAASPPSSLDLGDAWDHISPQQIILPDPFPLIDIASAPHRHLLLFSSGRVFCWGRGFPVPPDGKIYRYPDFPSHEEYTSVAISSEHGLVCSRSGLIWVFGSNNAGQFGISTRHHSNRVNNDAPVEVGSISPLKIIDAAVGRTSTLFLVDDDPLDLLFRSSIRRFGKNNFETVKVRAVLFHPCGQFFQQQLKANYRTFESSFQTNSYRRALRSLRWMEPFQMPASSRSKSCYFSNISFSRYDLEFGLFSSSKKGFRVQSVPLSVYCFATDFITISNFSEQTASFVIHSPSADMFAGVDMQYLLNINPMFFSLPPNTQIDVEFTLVLYNNIHLADLLPIEIKVKDKVYRVFFKIDLRSSPLAMVPEVPYSEISKGELIGSGATGSVLKVFWQGKTVAVKHYNQLSFLLRKDLKEFRREVMISGNLSHPNIVRCLGISANSSRMSIIFKYYPLGDLAKCLHDRSTPFSFLLTLKVALDVISGLTYLHNRRVIHRDIKPGNIILVSMNPDKKIVAKLTDFGGSTIFNLNRTLSVEKGTVRYAAPELLASKTYTCQVDIYSFAITMYECFTGMIPFSDLNFSAQVERCVLDGQRPVFPREFPAESAEAAFVSLIRQCWAADPNERPIAKTILEAIFMLSPPEWKITWMELDSLAKHRRYCTSESDEVEEI